MHPIHAAAAERILILDGAMGSLIQNYRLDEAGYRGARFATWGQPVKGNNDLLNLTRPDIIEDIHRQYLEAGADLIETNTFNAQVISMADYGMESLVREINVEGARLAKRAAEALSIPGQAPFCGGSDWAHQPHPVAEPRCQSAGLPKHHL